MILPLPICLKYSGKCLPVLWRPPLALELYFRKAFLAHMQSKLFAAAIGCCDEAGAYRYETTLYPVFLILKAYISVYPELSFLELTYQGNAICQSL